ncbi:MAG: hypothetical protein COT34_01620 [Candidatus Nealsonbacteria bacterium CG08_land_8_20_14_0_20_43_11]|uniref:Uncharacterized protein n=1 Tax=Candidatus Nealsonbacteria bacterium CG08_land_8_20_14_0_20_43_11 TaxID=1974706 RepID=A0A2M6T0H1_9BACT|nr:MAG: hypothetical protein COT34_01620 [Candidatus Nealsonbacteria bacterium CG08_land_8_20_14_0_20_43_11]
MLKLTFANPAETLGKLAKTCLLFSILVIPLFFLPGTLNFLDMSKQLLLVFSVFFVLFCWFLKSLAEGKFSFNFGIFQLPALIFILIISLATVFSAYPYASFWGWPLVVSASFLTSLTLVLFYFLVPQFFSQKEEIIRPLFLLILSGLVAALFSLLQLLGASWLPFNFAKVSSFNTVGTVNSLGVFLAGLLPLGLAIFSFSSRPAKILLGLFLAVCLGFFFLINFWVVWVSLLVSSALMIVFGITRNRLFRLSWLILPMIFLAFSLFALGIKTPLFSLKTVPTEIYFSLRSTFEICLKAIKDFQPPISWAFGSGPGTFVFDYTKYKPKEINQTVFWDTKLDSASSEVFDRLATTGILGTLSFLLVIGLAFFLGLKKFLTKEGGENSDWILFAGTLAAFAGITSSLFFYPANLSLNFLFWLVLAILFVLVGGKPKVFGFQSLTPASLEGQKKGKKEVVLGRRLLVSFGFIAFLILGLAMIFFMGQRYFAERSYLKALQAVQEKNILKAEDYLGTAVRLTGAKQDIYWRDLAQLYIFRVNEELAKESVSIPDKLKTINAFAEQAFLSSQTATALSPQNVLNWSVRGFVFGNLAGFIQEADNYKAAIWQAVNAYERALSLEPVNPYLFTELGKIHFARVLNITKEDDQRKEAIIGVSRENFEKAISLKPDYVPAHLQMAFLNLHQGKTKEAISELEISRALAPADSQVAFQLGLAYQTDDQLDKAKAELERAVNLDENYANARYFLGLLYDKEGDKEKAITQFEKILQLNPDNEMIKKILANLAEGKPALEKTEAETPEPFPEKE